MSKPRSPAVAADRSSFKARLGMVCAALLAIHVLAWFWALASFHGMPLLLGSAVLAYSLGLRHGFDADHIAAIDNVTRNLMQRGARPVGVGWFFSLGHSSVVMVASMALAATAVAFRARLESIHVIGGVVGTLVSATFLILIALVNGLVLIELGKTFMRVRGSGRLAADDLQRMPAPAGFLARLAEPLFRMISQSWHMYPLGILFGLGFDTATEIGVLGIAAAEASNGLSMGSILVFPVLFTAGMTLVDSVDSFVMIGAYGWAFRRPIRKLFYNLTITFISVVVALGVGGLEALGLVGGELGLSGPFWQGTAHLNDHFGTIGCIVVATFVASWVVAVALYRALRVDHLEAEVAHDQGLAR